MGPPTQERRAGSGTQQGAASGGRCRADCAEGTGHARCVCPHLHTRVHTQAALTLKHVCTYSGATPCTHKHTHTRADTQTRGTCVWARVRRCASTHTHTRGLTLRDVKAHVPTHHSGVRTLTHTQERALSGGSGRGWAHRAPIRRAGGTPHALTEGRVWRKVLPEGAWRRRWHWSAPGHSWPSCRCPEFLR